MATVASPNGPAQEILKLDQGGAPHLCGENGECTGMPLPYRSKLLHQLGQAGIVVAKRGTFGSDALASPPEQTSLLGLAECCDERACPTPEFWSKEQVRIKAKLQRITIRDVARFERRRRERLKTCCEPAPTPRGRR